MNFNIASSAAIHVKVQDWTMRVQKNGGAIPSWNTINALSIFYKELDNAGLTSQMLAVNCFVPDSISATFVPLIATVGSGSASGPGSGWLNHGPFISSDLTINGILSNGSTKYIDTGIVPSVSLTTTSVGLTIYSSTSNSGNGNDMGGANSSTQNLDLLVDNGGSAIWDCYNNSAGQGRCIVGNSGWKGYVSANRTSSGASAIYIANSTTAYKTLASISTTGGTLPTKTIYTVGYNQNGTNNQSLRRISFSAIHGGLTSIQAQRLYNAVQAMRQQLGGGWV